MLTKERKEKVVEALQKAIQAKSYSGEEKEVVEYLEKLFKDIGYDTVHIDRYGNIIGCIKGKKNGLKVLMDGHMDTVPVQEEKWKENAFGGEVKDGKIYGRGTSDMKGALISMALAGAYFAEDTKKDFSGEIYVAGIVHEECFEGVAAREVSKYVKPDIVIIGEASEYPCEIYSGGKRILKIPRNYFGYERLFYELDKRNIIRKDDLYVAAKSALKIDKEGLKQ